MQDSTVTQRPRDSAQSHTRGENETLKVIQIQYVFFFYAGFLLLTLSQKSGLIYLSSYYIYGDKVYSRVKIISVHIY